MLLNKREGTCLCAAQLWWTGASRPLSPPPKDKSRVTKDPALFRIPPHSQQPSPRRSVTLPLSPPPARLGTTTAIGDHDPNRPTLGAAAPPGPSTPPPQLGSLPPRLCFSPHYAILIGAEGELPRRAPRKKPQRLGEHRIARHPPPGRRRFLFCADEGPTDQRFVRPGRVRFCEQ
jgi:hypothetical protein